MLGSTAYLGNKALYGYTYGGAGAAAAAKDALANASQAFKVAPPVQVPNTPVFDPSLVPAAPSLGRLALYAGGGAVVLFVLYKMMKGSGGEAPVHENPRRRRNPERVPVLTRSDRLKRAVATYEGFHWGDAPDRIVKRKVSRAPKVAVKLGKLVSVAYETHKNGEHAVWEHEFGEEGGKRPDLVMDADTEKLHIVGGSYTVTDAGIID